MSEEGVRATSRGRSTHANPPPFISANEKGLGGGNGEQRGEGSELPPLWAQDEMAAEEERGSSNTHGRSPLRVQSEISEARVRHWPTRSNWGRDTRSEDTSVRQAKATEENSEQTRSKRDERKQRGHPVRPPNCASVCEQSGEAEGKAERQREEEAAALVCVCV